jgi:spore cortex formation protein SpoVR/YcgB (stage V sporulation)
MTDKLYITSRCDWSQEKIEQVYKEIEKIAYEEMELEGQVYPNTLEIISAEQMLDAYASIGLPIHYNHWSFGKDFLNNAKGYYSGRSGLAYEIVINTSPCISYLMEDNSMMMQALVIAHAAFGHNAVFKNNETFQQWTNAGSIIDYMVFAKEYIRKCEERYGPDVVEQVIDAAHALAAHGVDKFKRKHKPAMSEEARLQKLIAEDDAKQLDLDIIMKKTSIKQEVDIELEPFEIEEEENLLYYIMKNAPGMESWKREILRIVHKVNQYFYPQSQCVTGNNLISSGNGFLRLDEIISGEGYHNVDGLELITDGDRLTKVSHLYMKKDQKVMRIKTKSGKVIIGTPEHPLIGIVQGEHRMTKISDFKVGQALVLNLEYSNVFSKVNQVLVQPSLSKFQLTPQRSVNTPLKYPSELTPDLAEFLGFLNGCSTGFRINLSGIKFVAQETMAFRFKNLIFTNFGIDVPITKTIDDEQVEQDLYTVKFSSFGLWKFLEVNNLIQEDGTKTLTKALRMSSKESIASFLRAFIDVRGNLRTSISKFRVSLVDEDDAQELQTIFCALGIFVNITGPRLGLFRLIVAPCSRKKFESIIGTNINNLNPCPTLTSFTAPKIYGAKALLDKLLSMSDLEKDDHSKSVSGVWWKQKVQDRLLLRDVAKLFKNRLPLIRGSEVTVVDVERFKKEFEYISTLDIYEAKELTRLLKQSEGKIYDEIVEISEEEEGRDVYDVTVPENHLFWCSSLISHNTQNLNEGFASFTHYYIMTRLEEKGILSPDAYMAFLQSHAGVLFQPSYDKKYYNGLNPYALGFAILMDVKRICENPTDEDREWFTQLVGKRWQDEVKKAAFEHRDDSFIQQYLSPKVIRDLKLFSVNLSDDEDGERHAIVSEIHDEVGYRQLRTNLGRSYERVNRVPQIIVRGADLEGDRTLYLEYIPYKGRELDRESAKLVANYIDFLWGYPVELEDGLSD